MKRTDLIKSIALLLVIVAVFSAAMFGLNFHTGPLIEANNASAQFGPLLAVMPEGAAFDADAMIYDAAAPKGSSLTDVPPSVTAVYQEAAGLGYAVHVTATSNYSTAPMEISLGVSADGKIYNVQIDSYNDSEAFDFRAKDPEYLSTYVGKDSALADVGTVAGSTFSSTAFKTAVEEAMNTLIANSLIAEGVKSDDQLLMELLPTVFTGMANDGMMQTEEIEASGNMLSGVKALNDSGFAYIMTEGNATLLVTVNAFGTGKVFDVEGNDVTADHAALVEEAKAHAGANQASYEEPAVARFEKLMEGASNMQPLSLTTFGTIVAADSFQVGEDTYYGFCARGYGYQTMDIYVILDASGAIVKADAKKLFFDEEYFTVDDTVDQPAYKDSFTGLTQDTWTGDNALIAGATMTSHAMQQAVTDAFEAFQTVQNGGTAE